MCVAGWPYEDCHSYVEVAGRQPDHAGEQT